MRTKEQLLKDLRGVECELSPENLTCDGELSRQVLRRARRLNKEKEEIIAQLGYTPTDEEIWGY